MVFAFAPLAALLLGVSDIVMPLETLFLSVVLYVLLPLFAGVLTRRRLEIRNSPDALGEFVQALKPWSIIGLLATVVLLFGFQADKILSNPVTIVLIAIPLMLQAYGIFAITYAAARALLLLHDIAGPASLIGTPNFSNWPWLLPSCCSV